MVLRVVWTRKALTDLRAIKDYISRDSTRYAQLQVERIRSSASHLGRFPEIGRVLPEFPDEVWREILTGNYRVIYRIDAPGQRVFVLAVIHGMQFLRASMVEPR
jgi:plasmid stabilization system protein ParE